MTLPTANLRRAAGSGSGSGSGRATCSCSLDVSNNTFDRPGASARVDDHVPSDATQAETSRHPLAGIGSGWVEPWWARGDLNPHILSDTGT